MDPLSDTSIRFPDGDTYAVWTQTSAVPLPAAFVLFGSGLIGLFGFNRVRSLRPYN